MSRTTHPQRIVHLVAGIALAAALTGPVASASAPPDTLWSVLPAEGALGPGVVRSRAIAVDWRAIASRKAGDAVRLALLDGAVVTARIERRQETAGGFVLLGRLDTEPAGTVTLAARDRGLAGVVTIGATTQRIRGAAGGRLFLEIIDHAALPWCGLGAAARGLPSDAEVPAGAGDCDDGSVIDLLVVYTREARDAAGGTPNILAEIDLMVANMNEAMTNSLVQPEMHLVYARELSTPQDQISLGTLSGRDDGVVDGVHLLRDLYGGDEVAMVVSGGGGVALGLRNLEPEQEANMFCVNGRNSLPFIVAHEVGHNLGCCHARGDGGGCPQGGGLLFPYSNGHRFFGDSGTRWHTVMAYSPGVWSALYSNPLVLFDGVPTGVPEGEDDSADNTKTIDLAAFTVANFRCNDGLCEGLDLPSDGDDCNDNDVPDQCEIAHGLLEDVNDDGIPDECQCVPDIDGSGDVDFADILAVLDDWGPCPGCRADLNGDDVVDLDDLLAVLSQWGPCA